MKAGDKLWRVPNGRHNGTAKEVTVLSVGRKWAELDNGERCLIADGTVDGGHYTPPACCWESRGAYESHRILCDAWQDFRRLVDGTIEPPAGITVERIERARKLLLGLPL